MIIEAHHSEESLSVIEKLIEKNRELEEKLSQVEKELCWFKEQVNLSRKEKFGQSSEKSEYMQFDLFGTDQPEIDIAEAYVEEEIVVDEEAITKIRRKKSIGRRIDTSKLEREIVIHDLTDKEKCCGCCDNQMVKIGEERSEKIEHVPSKLKVIEHVRIKYACRSCETVRSGKNQRVRCQNVWQEPAC